MNLEGKRRGGCLERDHSTVPDTRPVGESGTIEASGRIKAPGVESVNRFLRNGRTEAVRGL
ncbi:MAG: hypothetical protein CME26_01780 [Gemmatimonadetes bacterium]|nr:hypothetical protein [Gemmatimonadota bacterium]